MKEELSLTLPTEQLAALIRLQVESIVNDDATEAPCESGSAERVVVGTESPIASQASNPTYGDECVASDSRGVGVALLPHLDVASGVAKQSAPLGTHSKPTEPPPAPSKDLTMPPAPAPTAEPVDSLVTTKDDAVSVDAESVGNAEKHTQKSADSSHIPSESQGLSSRVDPTASVSVIGRSQSSSSLASQDGGGGISSAHAGVEDSSTSSQTLRPPAEDASPQEVLDYEEYLKETEKIDKECRAARRVFEQRIQKHKIIQVKLLLRCRDVMTCWHYRKRAKRIC